MQKLFIWSKYDGGDDELREELKNGWRVVNSQSINEDNTKIHYILEKQTRKDKLEHLHQVASQAAAQDKTS